MAPYRDMTDEEWRRVCALLPELQPRAELRGRPLANTRAVLNGVLWVITSGAAWSAIPRRYPSYQTCHRRFKAWHACGALRAVLVELFGAGSEDLCDGMAARMRSDSASSSAPASAAVPPVRADKPEMVGIPKKRGARDAVPAERRA